MKDFVPRGGNEASWFWFRKFSSTVFLSSFPCWCTEEVNAYSGSWGSCGSQLVLQTHSDKTNFSAFVAELAKLPLEWVWFSHLLPVPSTHPGYGSLPFLLLHSLEQHTLIVLDSWCPVMDSSLSVVILDSNRASKASFFFLYFNLKKKIRMIPVLVGNEFWVPRRCLHFKDKHIDHMTNWSTGWNVGSLPSSSS